jgi:Bacterial Ig-like domain
MKRNSKVSRSPRSEVWTHKSKRRSHRSGLGFDQLELRTLPTASLSANSFGVVMFLSQTAGSTVGLSFNSAADTYTFTSSEGVAAGTIDGSFNYTQDGPDGATLQPVDQSSLDFTSLEFDQNVENISYNINSLATPTSFSDASLNPPSGTPLTDHLLFSPSGTAAAAITAGVSINYFTEFVAIDINDSADTGGQGIAVHSQMSTVGATTYMYGASRSMTSLTIQGGTAANSVIIWATPGGSATTPVTTTYSSNVTAGELISVITTGQNGPLDLNSLERGSSVEVGSVNGVAGILGNISITNSVGVALEVDDNGSFGDSDALLDFSSASLMNELTNLAPATIAYNINSLSGLVIDTDTGTNVLTVNCDDALLDGGTDSLTYDGGGSSSQLVLENGVFTTETYAPKTPGSDGGVITLPTTFDGPTITVAFSGLQAVDDLIAVNDYTFPEPSGGGEGAVDLLNGPTVESTATAQIASAAATPIFTTINYANKNNVNIDLAASSTSGASAGTGLFYNNTNAAGQATLDVSMGGAGERAYIEATPSGVATTISMGGGGDTATVLGTGLGAGTSASNFTIDGGPGTNGLVVDAAGTTAAFSPASAPAPGNGIVTFAASTSFAYQNFTNLTELANNAAPTIVAPPKDAISVYLGVPLNNVVVGAFTDPDLAENAGCYSATIDWGDDITSAGTVSPDPSSPAGVNEFFVTGSHTYDTLPDAYSSYPITISVTDQGGTFTSSANGSPVNILMPALVNTTTGAPIVTTGDGAAASTSIALGAVASTTATAGTLASFPSLVIFNTGELPPAPAGFAASIDWGDGTSPSTGIVTQTELSGVTIYLVAGSHTYGGGIGTNEPVTVTVFYEGQPQLVATATVSVIGLQVDPIVRLNALAGTPTGSMTVATFTGMETPDVAGYTALVDPGDGSGTVTATIGTSSPFTITTSGHTYAEGGSYDMTVTIRDAQGCVVGAATAEIMVNVTPLTGGLSPQSETGSSADDAVTSDNTPTFVGNTTPGTTVELFVASGDSAALPGTMIGTGAANSAGSWSATVVNAPLADGSYTITAEAVNSFGDVLSAAALGTVVVDTVGPVITAIKFNRFHDTLTVTYKDNLSGLDQASIADGAFYHLSAKPLSSKVRVPNLLLPTSIVVMPGAAPTDREVVKVIFNRGRAVRGGRYLVEIDAGSGDRGVHDVADNALDGHFYGTFPTGNGRPGGNFAAAVVTIGKHDKLAPVPVTDGYVAPSASEIDPPVAARLERLSVRIS